MSDSCDPVDSCSPPRSSAQEIYQTARLEWVASSGDLPDPGIRPVSSALQVERLTNSNVYVIDAMLCYAKSLQSCLTLCDPIDGSPPGSPVPGILQARTLEWVAISFSNA